MLASRKDFQSFESYVMFVNPTHKETDVHIHKSLNCVLDLNKQMKRGKTSAAQQRCFQKQVICCHQVNVQDFFFDLVLVFVY